MFEKKESEVDIIIKKEIINGKKDNVIVIKENVEDMRKGSVIVDIEEENGGNVEKKRKGEVYV
jgi:NAD/NADP transhydrogenase alpha subunit